MSDDDDTNTDGPMTMIEAIGYLYKLAFVGYMFVSAGAQTLRILDYYGLMRAEGSYGLYGDNPSFIALVAMIVLLISFFYVFKHPKRGLFY